MSLPENFLNKPFTEIQIPAENDSPDNNEAQTAPPSPPENEVEAPQGDFAIVEKKPFFLKSAFLNYREKKKNSKKEKKRKKEAAKKKRKRFRFITPLILTFILIGIIAGCTLNIMYCKSNFEVNFYRVETTSVSTELRIIVISDLHLSEYGEDNCELVERIESLNPDLIISAGDMVTYGEDNYDNMLSLCEKLSKIAPLYGVMGNHEDEKVYLENDKKMVQKFKDAGMKLFINEKETIAVHNDYIEIVGIAGNEESFEEYGGRAAMDNLEPNNLAFRIVIDHIPTLFPSVLSEYNFDLGIAGHTHGGVIRLPALGGLYSAEEGLLPKFDGGLSELENGATLFVSRGLGNSGLIPRFYNTPELAVIDVSWY